MGRADFTYERTALFPDLAKEFLHKTQETFSLNGGQVFTVSETKSEAYDERVDVNEKRIYHRQRLYSGSSIFEFAGTEETYSQWVNLNGQDYRVAIWLDGYPLSRHDRPPPNKEHSIVEQIVEEFEYIYLSYLPSLQDNEPIGVIGESISLMLFNESGEAVIEVPYNWSEFDLTNLEGFIFADIHDSDYQNCLLLQNAIDISIFKGMHVACLDGLDPFPAEVARGFWSQLSEQLF